VKSYWRRRGASTLEREAQALESTISSLTDTLETLQLHRARLIYDTAIAMAEAAEARARKYPRERPRAAGGAWASPQLMEICNLLRLPPGGFTAPIAA
jgi:hypothetical protein